jgi:hypothetical protein
VDDLVEFLDVSLDEAEKILAAARSVIEVRERSQQPATEEGDEPAEEVASEATAEDQSTPDPTEAGYDEAVKTGIPFQAEEIIRAEFSADPVALSEADPMTVDELELQEAGRDLRPDMILPDQDVAAQALADLTAAEFAEDAVSTQAGTESSSALESSSDEPAAKDESLKDEKQ